jgi:Zn-dependent M28 family amino/carboxypeptidase
VLVLAACTPASSTKAEFAEAGDAALAWTGRVVELGPRPVGSPAHRKLQELLVSELSKQDAQVVQEKFTAETPRGAIGMNNIIAKFPGSSGKIVVISGHYDTYHREGLHFTGANDAGSSTGALLALAELLKGRQLVDDVWLVFFDGEESLVEWRGEDHTYGSRHLAGKWRNDGTASRIKAVINLDMIGDADLQLVYEENSTPWLREMIWGVAERLGYLQHFPREARGAIADDHMPFIEAGYSAVDLIDFEYGVFNRYWHTEMDTIDKLSAQSFAIILHVVSETLNELAKRN